MTTTTSLPVAVIGSGPIGLSAAVHLLERGLEPVVFEAGDEVAAAVASWGHVRLFSPWRYSVDAAARRRLEPTGWTAPDPEDHPTGAELRERYLLPLARTLGDRVRTGARVLAVTRNGADKMKDSGREERPFELVVATATGVERVLARAVIDAGGTLSGPNPLGSGGVLAPGEAELGDHITYGVPDVRSRPERFAGRRVLVVGAGHSAMNVLQDLVALRDDAPATTVTWAVRRRAEEELFGGGENDGLAARGELGRSVERLTERGAVDLRHGVRIQSLRRDDDGITVVHDTGELGPFDEIVACTGFRPDLDMLREVRLDLDSSVEAPTRLGPLIDPNIHSCGSVPPHGEQELRHPEHGFYIAGLKSYGRAPTFLMLTGHEQVRSIAASLAGDQAAADQVELVLPETGVCRITPRFAEAPVEEAADCTNACGAQV